jgi:hypothetical protein
MMKVPISVIQRWSTSELRSSEAIYFPLLSTAWTTKAALHHLRPVLVEVDLGLLLSSLADADEGLLENLVQSLRAHMCVRDADRCLGLAFQLLW